SDIPDPASEMLPAHSSASAGGTDSTNRILCSTHSSPPTNRGAANALDPISQSQTVSTSESPNPIPANGVGSMPAINHSFVAPVATVPNGESLDLTVFRADWWDEIEERERKRRGKGQLQPPGDDRDGMGSGPSNSTSSSDPALIL